MELMVLSVEHILAFGLESEVLPTNTAFVAELVPDEAGRVLAARAYL